MDRKERYERESTAKGGSVPPDLRRHSDSRQTHAGTEANVKQDDQRALQEKANRERERRENTNEYY